MAYTPIIKGVVNTTDATVTTVLSIPVIQNTILSIDGVVIARRSGGSAGAINDGAVYMIHIAANNTSGTAAVIGNNTQSVGESQSSWDITCTASSSNILIQVTGAVNNNISWTAYIETLPQS